MNYNCNTEGCSIGDCPNCRDVAALNERIHELEEEAAEGRTWRARFRDLRHQHDNLLRWNAEAAEEFRALTDFAMPTDTRAAALPSDGAA